MFGLLLAAAVTFTAADARIAYEATRDFVKDCTPRHAGTVRGRLAAQWILDRVSRCGADAELDVFTAQTPDGPQRFANVAVELLAGREDAPWVVFLSHFDTAPTAPDGFQGANDGASTTGLLIALAGALRRAGRPANNVALVWTDAEEARYTYAPNDGFQGAKRALETFRARRRRIVAAVGLDMLGDRDLGIMLPANGSPALRRLVHEAARTAGLAKIVRDGREIVRDDFTVFFDAGIPAIDLIDFEFGSAPGLNDYWHTLQDTVDKVSEESLLRSGRIVAELHNALEGEKK